jgi:uncharacterized membrane protein YebE (DUF533 family)
MPLHDRWPRKIKEAGHVFSHVLVAAQNKGGGQNLGTIATVIGGLIGVAVLAYVGLSL